MPGARRSKYRTVEIHHRMKSDVLQRRQELQEELLDSLMRTFYEQVDFSDSIDRV